MVQFQVRDTDETLEIEITLDGQLRNSVFAATNNTGYYALKSPTAANTLFCNSGSQYALYRHIHADFLRQCLIRIRKTTAAGAGDLRAIIQYGLLKERP